MLSYAFEGTVQTPVPDWTDVPLAYKDKCAAVCRSMKDVEDLVHWFDNRPDFMPHEPILLLVPGVQQPVAVCGLGFATVAELRDSCREEWDRVAGRQAKRGSQFDFDDLREREGLMERDKVAEMTQYAFWDRVKRMKASPVTFPSKQYRYYRPTNPTQFLLDGLRKDK